MSFMKWSTFFYVLDLATMSFVAELKRRTCDFGVAPIFL